MSSLGCQQDVFPRFWQAAKKRAGTVAGTLLPNLSKLNQLNLRKVFPANQATDESTEMASLTGWVPALFFGFLQVSF